LVKCLSDFLNVLQSEKALYQSQDQRALSQQRLMLAVVAIFKALGGGWQNEGQSPAESFVQPVSSPAMQKLPPTKP
jgi:outer membrane protein TolC